MFCFKHFGVELHVLKKSELDSLLALMIQGVLLRDDGSTIAESLQQVDNIDVLIAMTMMMKLWCYYYYLLLLIVI